MKNTQNENTVEKLTNLLMRINKGEDPQILRKEANQMVTNLAPKDIASAENRLLDCGFSPKLVHQLSATFLLMGLFETRKGDLRKYLSPGHLVFQISTEHDLMRCFVANLESCVADINKADQLTSVSSEYRRLVHLSQHLNAAREHFTREQDVIFPMLIKHGLTEICREVVTLHADIEMAIKAVVNVTMNLNVMKTEDFKLQLSDVSQCLVATMLRTLAKEDNMLYAAAIKQIDDEAAWHRMKWICDDIGYCALHT